MFGRQRRWRRQSDEVAALQIRIEKELLVMETWRVMRRETVSKREEEGEVVTIKTDRVAIGFESKEREQARGVEGENDEGKGQKSMEQYGAGSLKPRQIQTDCRGRAPFQ